MNILQNKTNKNIDEIINIAERDGNAKRRYLLLNKLQAKYIPIKANEALSMFDNLSNEIKDYIGNIIVIGFAETATAIGARIAYNLSKNKKNNVTFLTTTRELCENEKPIVEFKEEHSHAVEQILYGNEEVFNNADYIVFAEDEVTTGNTICNCVKKLDLKCKYVVASLLNCMSDEEIDRFTYYNVKAYWLIKTDKEGFENIGKNESKNISYKKRNCNYSILNVPYLMDNPRLGINISKYHKDCKEIAKLIQKNVNKIEKVLILGTEECMYPSIIIANELDKKGYDAFVQSTTRVPACTNQNINYPLKDRYKVKSLYGERDTYIYNLNTYNKVYIISDGKETSDSLVETLQSLNNNDITYVYI